MRILRMVLVFILVLGMTSFANAAAYLKIGDIKGEAVDHDHKDWIIIESMSSPITRAIVDVDSTTGQCSAGLRGGPTPGDVVVVKELDKSSPKIQEAVCNGTFYPEVIIDFVSTSSRGAEPYLRYKLTNVIVTSYGVGPGTNGAGDAVPMEDFNLNYGEIEFEYVKF